jgi:CcmD family protein
MFRTLRILSRSLLGCALGAVAALPVGAQTFPGSTVGAQTLRPYHFVFIAYTLAWILVLGWVVAVARRLARLEKRLES